MFSPSLESILPVKAPPDHLTEFEHLPCVTEFLVLRTRFGIEGLGLLDSWVGKVLLALED